MTYLPVGKGDVVAETDAKLVGDAIAQDGLRERIVHAATRLFAERGYNATSMREIVGACGCTKPALYYYFKNKEALFLELLRKETSWITAMVEEQLGRATAGDASVYELMVHGTEIYFTNIQQNELAFRMLVRADMQPDEGQPAFDFVSLRSNHLQMVKGIIELGVERGELRADVDLDDATYAMSGVIEQRIQYWLEGEPLPADLPTRLVDLFFRGVRA